MIQIDCLRYKQLALLTLLTLAVVTSGCQHNLRVSVQMIEPKVDATYDTTTIPTVTPASLIGRVQRSMQSLYSYKVVTAKAENKAAETAATEGPVSMPLAFNQNAPDWLTFNQQVESFSLPPADKQDLRETGSLGQALAAIKRDTEDQRTRLEKGGTALLDELASASPKNKEVLLDFVPRVTVYTAKVSVFMNMATAQVDMAIAEYESQQTGEPTFARYSESIASARQEANAARSGPNGFGGVRSVGVNRIAAGDPIYKYVLSGKPVGDPITMANAGSLGDSTLIFVQEAPTQIRGYRVDTDSTTLVNNVVSIGSQVLQAYTKYMTGKSVPVPALEEPKQPENSVKDGEKPDGKTNGEDGEDDGNN